ncbi:hypothetical protein OAB79_03685 [Yoonia sp.]|nr:hypothetical protein [Yoonia sp.]
MLYFSRDILVAAKSAMSAPFRDIRGNAAILGIVAVLALTVWGVGVAGLIAVLAPHRGIAAAIFAVAFVMSVLALILLGVLRRRLRLQRERAAICKAEIRQRGQAAAIAILPRLLRRSPGAFIMVVGLAVGAVIAASLRGTDP